MKKVLLLLLLASTAAQAGHGCPPVQLTGIGGEPTAFVLVSDHKLLNTMGVRLYSGDKLRTIISVEKDGSFKVEALPEGEYRLLIPEVGNVLLKIVAPYQHLNLPVTIISIAAPKMTTVNGNKVWIAPSCPLIGQEAN
jgi:hypothetical protein